MTRWADNCNDYFKAVALRDKKRRVAKLEQEKEKQLHEEQAWNDAICVLDRKGKAIDQMTADEMSKILLAYGVKKSHQGKNKGEKKRKLEEFFSNKKELKPFKQWTDEDEIKLTKLKETDIDIKDTTLCRMEEAKKLEVKAILGRISEEERVDCMRGVVGGGDNICGNVG